MIKTEHLGKTFVRKNKEEVRAVKDVSFTVDKGELFGLLGPDGAGKTTLIRMLCTLYVPTTGTASLNDFDTVKDFKQIRKIVGYMPGTFSLYTDLSIQENLEFFANIFDTTVDANYDLYKDIYVQLEPFKNRRAGQLSGGMKQKLALCCALIHKPEILLLDEPTTGVDAVSRMEFWQMLQNLKNQGITMLVSTPYMDEAEQCDRVALIQEGEIMDINTPKGITDRFPKPLLKVKDEEMLPLLVGLRSLPNTQNVYAFGEYSHVVIDDENHTEAWKKNAREKFPTIEIAPCEPNIEDSFIYLLSQRNED